MNPLAVLIPIPDGDTIPQAQRLTRQRRTAREAVAHAARQLGLPTDGWTQDAQRIPVPRDGYHWSITHKPCWAAAVIADRPVGIDIESLKPRRRPLWDACATQQERSLLADDSWPSFFRLWTAKEAVLKANRVGLVQLDNCLVTSVRDDRHMTLSFAGATWFVEQHVEDNHITAVACDGCPVNWCSPGALDV